jgi:hypothetical protein
VYCLYRRLAGFVFILAVAHLLITWELSFYYVLETQTPSSSLPHQTSLEKETSIILDYGEAVYPREIDDPADEQAIFSNHDFVIVTRRSNQHAQNQDRATILYPYPTR